MKAATKRFEIKFNREKAAIERQGVRMFNSMFRRIYKNFLDRAMILSPDQWAAAVSVSPEIIENTMIGFYQRHSSLAMLVKDHLSKQKADAESIMWENVFRDKLKNIVKNEAGKKIVSIANTTQEKLLSEVQETLLFSEAEGYGIDKIKKLLVQKIGANLKGNANYRARAIAQTEMISASNRASFEAANSTGYETRKFWSTSGLAGVRESHIEAETYSDSIGGLKENETFPNGLLYPGDPNGAAEEVINCRCTLLHELI